MEKQHLTQQKHIFPNQKKCTTTQNKHKKSIARFSQLLQHPHWKRTEPILVSALHKFVTYLFRHLPHHTTTILQPFFLDHPGELVPEENFWTLWCKGRLTEAKTPTTQLAATPSGLTSAHLHHPPFFYRPDALPATQPTASEHLPTYLQLWIHTGQSHPFFIQHQTPDGRDIPPFTLGLQC